MAKTDSNIDDINLAKAWNNWVQCLNGNDVNSIFQQIVKMNWDTAIYHVINRGKTLKGGAKGFDAEINPYFDSFITRHYLQSQYAIIRRLSENTYQTKLEGPKGVYSLGALLKDIKEYREVLNRKQFFRLRNRPYDYSDTLAVPPEFDWEFVEEMHQIFDRLSGKIPSQRSPDDVIMESVFDVYERKLERTKSIENIKKIVDKYIAHLATPESRKRIENVDLADLWNAQKEIFLTANFLSLLLSSSFTYPLLWPKGAFFLNWDKAIYPTNEVGEVREIFESYKNQIEDWFINGDESI